MYKINKSQFLVIWAIGSITILISFVYGMGEESIGFILASIIFAGVLVFYTIGWRSANPHIAILTKKAKEIIFLLTKIGGFIMALAIAILLIREFTLSKKTAVPTSTLSPATQNKLDELRQKQRIYTQQEILDGSQPAGNSLTGYVVAFTTEQQIRDFKNGLSPKGSIVVDPVYTNNGGACTFDSTYFSYYILLSGVQISIVNNDGRYASRAANIQHCNNSGAYYLISDLTTGNYTRSIKLPSGWILVAFKGSGPEWNSQSSTFNIRNGENTLWFYIVPSNLYE